MFKRKMENLCPMMKRRKLIDHVVNGGENMENADEAAALILNENHNDNENNTSQSADDNLLKNQLRQFDVLDEVQGDGSSSEYGGNVFYLKFFYYFFFCFTKYIVMPLFLFKINNFGCTMRRLTS